MYFHAPNLTLEAKFDSTPIQIIDSYRLLGINIDKNMKFSTQCLGVVRKLNSCIYLLCRCRKFLPQHVLKLIFNCIGFSYITYCIHSYYDFLRTTDKQKLKRKYSRCGRMILDDNLSSNDEIINALNWSTLDDLVMNFKQKLLKDIISGRAAPTLSSYLSKPLHGHQTRFSQASYEIKSASKDIGTKAFSFWAPHILNDIL